MSNVAALSQFFDTIWGLFQVEILNLGFTFAQFFIAATLSIIAWSLFKRITSNNK